MSKKFKRYLVIISSFLLMLNMVSIFPVFAEDVIEINYTDYYLDLSEIPELQGYEFLWDSTKDPLNPGFEKYFYSVDTVNNSSYDDYISGEKDYFVFAVYYYDLTNVQTISNDYQVIPTTTVNMQRVEYEYYRDGTLDHYTPFIDYTYMEYNPKSGYVDYDNYEPFVFDDQTHFDVDKYYIHIESNHPDFPVPDFLGSGSSSSALDVHVNFDPELTGDFQRRAFIDNKIVTLDTLNFSVTNSSDFPIQYIVAIVARDDFFSIYSDNAVSHPNGKVYSGNPTYVYVTDEWCYLPSGSSKKNVTSTYCPSSWHYVDAGSVDNVTVSFDQMKLAIGVIYNVYVYAVKNTQDSVCVIPYNLDSYQYNQDYVLNFAEAQLVYSSDFTCSNPAEFNPNSNDGSYAFDSSDTSLFNRANGYIDANGEVVIDRIDTDKIINGSDSWGNNYENDAWDTYYSKQNSVSSDLNQLSLNFSSFFKFLNKAWSFFPQNFQSVISLGLISIVVLGVIKVVIL